MSRQEIYLHCDSSPLLFYFILKHLPLLPFFITTEPLLDLACLKVSDELMGKSPEEIRVMLNIPKMTPEEEAKARQEHRWIFADEIPGAPAARSEG